MRKGLFYISGILIFTLLLSSCVSKKKYEELARAKRSIDREVATLENDKKSLESEMQKLKDDFNAVRYQLTANNAAKDKQIDDLNTQLRALQSKESALKSELKDVSEQVKSKVQSSEGQLAELQLQLKRTTEERDQIRKQLTDYKTNADWDNRKLSNEVEHIKSSLKFKDSEIARLEKEIAEDQKIERHAEHQKPSLFSEFLHQTPETVVEQNRKNHEHHIPRFAPGIEKEAEYGQDAVFERFGAHVVEEQDAGEKNP